MTRPLLILGALAAAAPLAASAAAPADLFYERALMNEAGRRCALFEPAVAAALAASAQQARGAALRGGALQANLAVLEQRAKTRAAGVPCNSADLATAAERVRQAFAGYGRMTSMEFPGEAGAWRADRTIPRQGATAWRLSQGASSRYGPVAFGLAGDTGPDVLTAVAGWPSALAASSARLVMRDPLKAPGAYIDPRKRGLEGRAPPRGVTRAFLASNRSSAAPGLLPTGVVSGAAFRFSDAATRALEGLDPREAVVLEVVYPTRMGERVESIWLEVGDFAAARSFLASGA